VVHDIPLLVETGQAGGFDVVLVVDVPVEVQVERLTAQRGMAAEEAQRRIASQASREDRLAVADVVVDNAGKTHGRVHFGATVTILYETGDEREVTIVGVDELDVGDARVSWRSPLARALLTAKVGDTVTVRAPRGPERIEIVAVRYDNLS